MHRASGVKQAPRGIRRYPWAVVMVLVILLAGIGSLYYLHLGPFAPPAVAPKHTVAKVTPTVTATPATFAASPCNASSVVQQLTDTAAAPTAAQFNANQHTYSAAPAMSIDTSKVYCVGFEHKQRFDCSRA